MKNKQDHIKKRFPVNLAGNFFTWIFLVLFFFSCGTGKNNSSAISPAGKLKGEQWMEYAVKETEGYHVEISQFIQGRIRAVEVKGNFPFGIKVTALHTNLYEKKIYIRALNTEEYEIVFSKNLEPVYYRGIIGKKLVTPEIILTVEWNLAVVTRSALEAVVEKVKEGKYYFIARNRISGK